MGSQGRGLSFSAVCVGVCVMYGMCMCKIYGLGYVCCVAYVSVVCGVYICGDVVCDVWYRGVCVCGMWWCECMMWGCICMCGVCVCSVWCMCVWYVVGTACDR